MARSEIWPTVCSLIHGARTTGKVLYGSTLLHATYQFAPLAKHGACVIQFVQTAT